MYFRIGGVSRTNHHIPDDLPHDFEHKEIKTISFHIFHAIFSDFPATIGMVNRPDKRKEYVIMKSNNNAVVPEAREALDKFKMEAASEVGVYLPS